MNHMPEQVSPFIMAMTEYEKGCPHRINHFLKVYSFAKMIGEQEKLDSNTQTLLEIAAVLHDIGIRPSLEKYQSSAGNYQELEGPPIARKMLETMSVPKNAVDRICFLIGHHHTYTCIDGLDYQILIEADFLVNIYEDELKRESILSIRDKYFKTETGKSLLERLYLW